jgi:hypothetical protein
VAERTLTAEEKIALARACIEALNARDFGRYFASVQPDFVICTGPVTPGGRVVVGHSELNWFFSHFLDTWDDVRYEFVDGPRPEGERLFSKDRWVGRDKVTGEETSTEFYSVSSFRDGLVSRVDMFGRREDALAFARSGNPEP